MTRCLASITPTASLITASNSLTKLLLTSDTVNKIGWEKRKKYDLSTFIICTKKLLTNCLVFSFVPNLRSVRSFCVCLPVGIWVR